MSDDHDAAWQKVKPADPAARLSYDASALSALVAEVRAQSVGRASVGLDGILESPAALLAAPSSGRPESEPVRWKKHWRGLTAGAGALVLAGGLTAGGIAASARTGWFGEPGSENGTSEMIDQRGDDYVQLVLDAEPEGMVYPAGLTGADASEYILSTFPPGEFAFLSEAGISADYCHYAHGMWILMWKRAFEANDTAGQKSALEQIDDAVMCAENYHVWGDGLYDFLMDRQTQARAGNPAPLLQDIQINTNVAFQGILAQALESAQ